MSIRELAVSDTELVGGGDWWNARPFENGTLIDWFADGFLCTVGIGIAVTNPSAASIGGLLLMCHGLVDDIRDARDNNTSGWVSASYTVSDYNMGEMYITGFSMNDSYGGEPSI
jgi:hypothetical protein